jgi:hypothetical protein
MGGAYDTYGGSRGVYCVLMVKLKGERPLRRPVSRWEDYIEMDL